MTAHPVLIAGGGIGGLATALTLHQIGVRCLVLEAVPELKPLGVGINLQPNAVRELYDLGIGQDALDQIGVQAREWALVGLNGKDVYTEPRGIEAGYNWPQYSVHRGQLQMLLLDTVRRRLGEDAVQVDSTVVGYRSDKTADGVWAQVQRSDGSAEEVFGSLLIGADGLHSNVRQQMYPDQPPPQWGGQIMWRGTSLGEPIRTGASFVGLGTHTHRLVFYPITPPDPESGLAVINWIAEITVDNQDGRVRGDWNRRVAVEDFILHFASWNYDWMDVPAMLRRAERVYEYPMIDRDPVHTWVDGRVALLGDAAHVMYPVGSNGASQAIVDARVLGAALVEHGICEAALRHYDDRLCAPVSGVVLRNRGAGPFGILNLLHERCGGVFDDIEAVLPAEEVSAFMAAYRRSAGLEKETLNLASPTIPPGARVRG